MDKDRRIAQLETLLLDAWGLLDHYTSGRPDNWDGTTRTQALATIRDIKKALGHERT